MSVMAVGVEARRQTVPQIAGYAMAMSKSLARSSGTPSELLASNGHATLHSDRGQPSVHVCSCMFSVCIRICVCSCVGVCVCVFMCECAV